MKDIGEVLDSMLACRGYTKDSGTLTYVKDNKTLPVYYDTNTDLVDTFQFLQECTDEEFILLIMSMPMTKKNIDKINLNVDLTYYDKIFFLDEILDDPTTNPLVPIHRLATKEEVESLKRKHIRLNTLPRLLTTDIICRWYGFKVGDIIMVERDDGKQPRIVTSSKTLYLPM